MKKLLQLICMAALMLLLTQCRAQDLEQPLGTWQMTYNDYRILRYHTVLTYDYGIPVPKDMQDHARIVSVSTIGDQMIIKGMFPEYPDASVKGFIKGDSVYFEPTQRLEGTGGKPVYVHTGFAEYEWPHTKESVTQQISFKSAISMRHIEVSDNGEVNSMKIWNGLPFWLSDDKNGNMNFYSKWNNDMVEGTGFPEAPNYIIITSFRKVSDNNTLNVD